MSDPMVFWGSAPNGNPNGDPQNNFYNPGSVNPSTVNPYAGAILQDYQNVAGGMAGALNPFLNPNQWNHTVSGMQDQAGSDAARGYAAMGLAGTPMAQGGVGQARTAMGYAELMRQPQMTAMALRGYTGAQAPITHGIMGIQGQFGGYQNSLLDYQLGEQQTNADMTGQMFGAAGGMAGHALSGYGRYGGGGDSITGMDPSALDDSMTGGFDPSGGYNFGDWSGY